MKEWKLLTGNTDSNFIEKDGIIEVDWFELAHDGPDPYLRKIISDNNLESDGEKEKLIKRLADNNVTLEDLYKITPLGRNYLKEFSWIAFYEEFLLTIKNILSLMKETLRICH